MHDQKEKSGTGKRKRFISPSGDLSLYLRERTCGFRKEGKCCLLLVQKKAFQGRDRSSLVWDERKYRWRALQLTSLSMTGQGSCSASSK